MLGNSKQNPAVPNVLWAQRANQLFVTIEVHDCEDPQIKMVADKVEFSARAGGTGAGMDKKWYRVELPLHGSIDPEASRYAIAPRYVFIELAKKEQDQAWWPRLLTKSAGKPFWLKTDFSKWKDEDEEEEESNANDPLQGLNFQSPGGLGDMQNLLAGMGGGAGNDDDEEVDSDDDMAVDSEPPNVASQPGNTAAPQEAAA